MPEPSISSSLFLVPRCLSALASLAGGQVCHVLEEAQCSLVMEAVLAFALVLASLRETMAAERQYALTHPEKNAFVFRRYLPACFFNSAPHEHLISSSGATVLFYSIHSQWTIKVTPVNGSQACWASSRELQEVWSSANLLISQITCFFVGFFLLFYLPVWSVSET